MKYVLSRMTSRKNPVKSCFMSDQLVYVDTEGNSVPTVSYLQEMEDIGAQFERMPNDEWLELESATEASLKDLLESDVGLNITTMAGWQKPAGSTIFADVSILRRALCLQDLVISRKTWDVSGYDTAICDLCQLSEMVFDPKNGTTGEDIHC
ncbi:hypothetical protein Bbelb_282880 [Branchiostoma belcheri]|nr:hypothetical protein Bbelb_282880 [Branchiostoma belcheri]